MKRQILAGAITIGTLGAAGAVYEHAPEATARAVTETIPSLAPKVDVDVLPATLPHSIEHELGAIVSTQLVYNSGSETDSVLASAVRVARNKYLSAGHYLYSGTDQFVDGDNSCNRILSVMGPSTKASDVVGRGDRNYKTDGVSLPVYSFTGSFLEGDTSSTIPDVSLIYAPDANHDLSNQETIPIADSEAKVGEAGVFTNYQPTEIAHVPRSPSESDEEYLTGYRYAEDKSYTKLLTQPAVFGGVVIAKQANGDLVVLDDEKSYDRLGDTSLVAGGSGGGFENLDGQLMGVSDEAYSETDPFTIGQIDQKYDIDITGLPADAKGNIVIVQTVTKSLERDLNTNLKSSLLCKDYK
jgi:hypothetical protein